MSECATVSFARPITAAAGVYAPGHIGELTQYLPFELVDDLLSQTKTVQHRLRVLPSRVGVYFVLALVLFPRLGYARVWQKLTAGLVGLDLPSPSEKALRDLRRRLGPAPFKALFEVVAGPLGQPHTGGVLPRHAHRRVRRLQLAARARHRSQPFVAGSNPLPDGLRRLPHAADDDPDRDRHPRHAGGGPRLSGRPRRGVPGPPAAAVAAPEHGRLARPGLRRHCVPSRPQPDRRAVPGARQVAPPATGAQPPSRWFLPVRPPRVAGTHHRRGTDRHRRRRQPGPRPLPADHHLGRPPPSSGGRPGPALP